MDSVGMIVTPRGCIRQGPGLGDERPSYAVVSTSTTLSTQRPLAETRAESTDYTDLHIMIEPRQPAKPGCGHEHDGRRHDKKGNKFSMCPVVSWGNSKNETCLSIGRYSNGEPRRNDDSPDGCTSNRVLDDVTI